MRLGLIFPALIQRCIVGDEIAKCLQAVAEFTQGSESVMGMLAVSFGFMMCCTRSFVCNHHRKPRRHP